MVLMGDKIVIKTKLKNADMRIAEIIDFEEVNYIKGSIRITVVKYIKNNEEKTAIVYKGKKDKIGDKILIATDDDIAARDKIYIKEEMSVGAIVMFMVVFILLGQTNNEFFMYANIILLVIVAMLALLHPHTYKSQIYEIKRKLGWHEKDS